jgi:hypothetical protein
MYISKKNMLDGFKGLIVFASELFLKKDFFLNIYLMFSLRIDTNHG